MKVICIDDNYKHSGIDIGGVYDADMTAHGDPRNYYISKDNESMGYYPKSWFKPLHVIREQKLKELGI